ncbi:MAG: hypothetical protein MI919_36180 [Holophagales bacterium]|nr:hypothetical protein [Holophagales bacterium]
MSSNVGTDLRALVAALEGEVEAGFESRLRAELGKRDPAWLVEALVQRILGDRHLEEARHRQLSRRAPHVESPAERRRRLDRIRALGLDEGKLRGTVERYHGLGRAALEAEGYLLEAPHKGKELLGPEHRTQAGEALLGEANDLLYALLFCDEGQGLQLARMRRDFLTVTLPASKADSLERFLLAVTETRAAGTWLDPEGVSDDVGAANKILQVEYGDTADGLVSDALISVLRMINDLEVNEEILYARIERLDRSTLVD